MTKEEFIELASKNWDKIKSHKSDSENLYDYEKGFDELWVEFGRKALEGSIGEISGDRRKKNQI
jgi:soluble cytochrome b562